MDGARAFVVALLLCVAPVGGAVVAETTAQTQTQNGDPTPGTATLQAPAPQTTAVSNRSMTVIAVENTSGYLGPNPADIDRTDSRTSGLDVAAAVEADGNDLESAYLDATFRQRYEAADTDAEREAVVEEATSRLADRVETLSATEARAIRRYNEGAIDTGRLLRTLAVVSSEAETTDDALEWFEDAADDLGASEEAERAAGARVRLVPMMGPVRAELASAVAGEKTLRVHVETVDGGIVLAAVDRTEGQYLREAHDPTAKTETVGDQYDGNPSPALDRFTELYPWTIESFDAIDAIGPERSRLYRFGASHPHGDLETYLDSGSTEILHERQWIDPAEVPSNAIERTEGDLRVVVNTTRSGGPLGVRVVDAETASPVDADVELNGDPIGSTGGDRLWVVAPRGPATVNATHAGETVTVETALG